MDRNQEEALRRIADSIRDQARARRDEFEFIRDRLDDLRNVVSARSNGVVSTWIGAEVRRADERTGITIPWSIVTKLFKYWPHLLWPTLLALSHSQFISHTLLHH